jgi:hypothetical protein
MFLCAKANPTTVLSIAALFVFYFRWRAVMRNINNKQLHIINYYEIITSRCLAELFLPFSTY